MDDSLNFDTLAVRAGTQRSEYNEHSEALFLTSSFCFKSAADAAERFANSEDYFTYSRFTNPTVSMFQDRLAALEGGEACIATASGMAAIMSVVMSALQAGDHLVSSRSLFGSTLGMFSQIFSKFGITTTFVDPTDLNAWREAVRPETKMFFLETPSNPLTELADIEAIGKIAKAANALFVVDNCFCSPVLQQPLKLGADVVMHSATKFLDGQGRVLGGAVLGSKAWVDATLQPFVRNTGPSLSAFNAWLLLKGLETLALRVAAAQQNAVKLADWLAAQPAIARLWYPGRADHPQAALAAAQMAGGGTVVSFELAGGKPAAFALMNALRLILVSNNLGDAKSMVTHPATTTHQRIGAEERARLGITDGVVRLSVGLEDVADLRADLQRGLLVAGQVPAGAL